MDLSQLKRKMGKFKLTSIEGHEGKEFRLRPFNLSDEAWLQQTFGDQITNIFEEVRMVEIGKIVWHQMLVEDKKFFKKRDIEFVDEEGYITSSEVGGLELLQQTITGWEDYASVVNALLDTIGMSRPELIENEGVEAQEGDKKKV